MAHYAELDSRTVLAALHRGRAPRRWEALDDPRLRERLTEALRRLNAGAGSASRVERLLLLDEPPDLDAGEITDKGYVNQRRVLERRGDAVAHLYADPPPPDVITSTR